ncbi:Mov34/MPN/PAD-1 family protein [Vibrio diabolicus]|uniref:Mov34/MPN/PAD-1 family protein n=1 Tax=Vibrio diabolicus TaxID=50719 RepID=UPI00106EDD1B|nr:Mov34/MPN/PAD-1 family protein [Vibrio diabolicus]
MPELISNLSGDVYILLQDEVLRTLETHRQLHSSQVESGGILIGEYRGEDINVVTATKPSFGDIQSRFRFFRRSLTHQQIALRTWRDSDSTRTFIGDWHTHAEDHPYPSIIDTSDWSKKLPNRNMIVIIQGRVTRWYGFWDGEKLTQAKLVKC